MVTYLVLYLDLFRLQCANSWNSYLLHYGVNILYHCHDSCIEMKRLTAYVSGKVQKVGYRARVIQAARVLGLTGIIENLQDGRVKIIAEGDDNKLKWFEEAINIRNTLIQVSGMEMEYSPARGELSNFYKLVGEGETDARLDTAASYLKDLIAAVNNMNNSLGGKIDKMNTKMDEMNSNLGGKMDNLLVEVKESRKDLKGFLDQRFERIEDDVADIKVALKAKGII
jgi:acylphosphatase